jgi:penicillin-binding protein 2
MVIAEHGGHGGSAAAPIARKIVDWYMENRPPGDVLAEDDGTFGGES